MAKRFKQYTLDKKKKGTPFTELGGQYFLSDDINMRHVPRESGGKLSVQGRVDTKIGNVVLYDAVVDKRGKGDYKDIQGALNDNKKVIYIRQGTYEISNPINVLLSDVLLVGEDRKNTIIKFVDGYSQSDILITLGDGSNSYNNIVITDLTINANNSNASGAPTRLYGIKIEDKLSKIIINNCFFNDNYTAITISGSETKNIVIRNNEIYDFDGIAVSLLSLAELCLIEDNYIHQADTNNGSAIILTGGLDGGVNHCVVKNNLIDTMQFGISIKQDAKNNILTNNIIKNIAQGGIYLTSTSSSFDTFYNIVTNNQITSCGYNGILVSGSKRNIIVDNVFKNNSQNTNNTYSDIILSVNNTVNSEYNIIKGNMIFATNANKSKYGIREDDANQDYNIIVGNIVQNAVTANISTQGANTITANNIS